MSTTPDARFLLQTVEFQDMVRAQVKWELKSRRRARKRKLRTAGWIALTFFGFVLAMTVASVAMDLVDHWIFGH
jgi:hypothetical protein